MARSRSSPETRALIKYACAPFLTVSSANGRKLRRGKMITGIFGRLGRATRLTSTSKPDMSARANSLRKNQKEQKQLVGRVACLSSPGSSGSDGAAKQIYIPLVL